MVLRVWPRSALWLDEAQSVSIASEPLTSIPDVLRVDGAPPLYYMVLHVWMELFGSGDNAVRSLSIALSLAAIALAAVAAGRLCGRRAALVAAVVIAANPFAIRYASETRMYALVAVEVLIGVLLVDAALRAPRLPTLGGLALTTAALLYTHYWAMYLVFVTLCALGVRAWRGAQPRRPASATVVAMLVGLALWAPWLPTLAFQSEHTATPWTQPPGVRTLWRLVDLGTNGDGVLRHVLGVALFLLSAAAIAAARRRSGGRFALSPRAIGITAAATVVVAIVGAAISGSAYSSRYATVVFPLVVLAATAGIVTLPRRLQASAVAVVVAVGVSLAITEIRSDRTTAATTVPLLVAAAQPGDVVVYCPDQLGPAASRLIDQLGPSTIRQEVFPPGSTPQRVDWIDYRARHDAADGAAFVDALDAGGTTIWMIWSGTYPATQEACLRLFTALSSERPGGEQVAADDPSVSDHGALWRFDPPGVSR